MAKVYEMYEARLHGNNALDFDDLLIKTVRLLRDVDEVEKSTTTSFATSSSMSTRTPTRSSLRSSV